MNDSDQDFTDICSRLLKRVRKKGAGGSGDEKRSAVKDEEPSSSSSERNPPKRRKKTKDATKSQINGRTRAVESGDVSQRVPEVSGRGKVKDAVIQRMQRFKRASPERLLHAETNQPTTTESDGNHPTTIGIQQTDASGDEALALQLQQELDCEARAAGDVEDEGLFFCQLCQKDLSAMSPPLRTQHINRCLDASESSAPSASHHSHRRPRVPECPICGKSFKSEKSRSVHLKRCSTNLGVKPNDLLQALRRQAAERASDNTTDQSQLLGSGTTTRRDGMPLKKRTRRKAQKLDEDTMVALALSRSILEREMEKERELEEREILAQLSSPPALQWKPGAGKGRGKRKKGVSPVHPPLLLIQDPQTALNRLQERVSSLLLRSRSPYPPTPTLSPSALPLHPHAPLWDKSALHGGGPDSVSEFYTSELSNFIQPWVAPEREKGKSLELTPNKKPQAVTLEADSVQEKLSDQSPAKHQTTRPLTPCSGTPGSQALQDLIELAEEGMTLTQYGYTMYTAAGDKSVSDNAVNELPSSGFVPETNDNKSPKKTSVYVSKLASDLSSMLNSPQLSDVQLQVDSGDVFFTHSFMLYTRCPLLANMVHDSGFGVQEEGMPVAQRVLLGNVLGEAVLALLQYLYTAHCPLTHTLLPHIQELADRFGLVELQQQCEEYSGSVEENPREESEGMFPAPEPHLRDQEDQNLAESNFLELLQSMWQHGDSEEEDDFKETAGEERDMEEEREGGHGEKEDRVDEEELDEIYEFAATQRKIETVLETATEEEEGDANTFLGNEKKEKNETESLLEKSAGSCYSNKQGADGTEAAMVTSPTETLKNPNSETERACLIPELDENRDSDASLDKSYDGLFSQSVGEYMEPSQTQASCSQQQCYKPSSTLQQNTPAPFRPSCVSEVTDLSISPPPSSGVSGETSFPMPGVSPVLHEGEYTGTSPLRKDSSGCQGIENPPSPPESQSKQVELIVLSDSGDEMYVDNGDQNAATTKRALTPPSPCESPLEPPQRSTSYACKVTENSFKESGSQGHAGKQVDVSKQIDTDIEATSDRSEHCSPGVENESVFDGSAEVSWLIPATPVPSTHCSSAQTCISMRRTQLFPKSSSSSSSSSVSEGLKSASSASSSSSCLKEKPATLSTLHKSYQSPSKECHSIETDRSPGYQRPLHHLRLSQVSSTGVSDGSHIGIIMGHPTQGVPKPSSSTPLHSDSSLQHQIPFCSPMVDDRKVQLRNCRGNSRSFGRQGKVDLVSLQLSSPSKTPEKQQSSSLQQGCSSPSPNSPRYIHPESLRESENDGIERMELGENPNQSVEELRDIAGNSSCDMDETGRGVREENPNQSVDEVVDIAGNSFCVMDEPPIAFDDSCGLDGGVGSQKPCFSLRLDSSGGTVSPPGLEGKGPTSTSPLATGACNKIPDQSPGPFNHSLPDPDMWDDWEEEEVAPLPLSQRLTAPSAKRVAELKTPVACRKRNKGPLVPITPMPGFSDMDTPELKNRLNRFGVRPLPKKQMVLKLKEIHQYTHQLQSSESEEETSGPQRHPNASNFQSAPLCFKQPTAPPAVSPVKLPPSEEDELLSASQNSNTSSTAESERSNPELCVSEDDDSDSEGITASQAVVREKDKLLAVRQFILSDPKLYTRVLQYQPLSLAELRSSLKAAGIRLGAAKLLDFLDSQCITFSTAKQGQNASSRRKRRVKTTTSGGAAGRGRKKAAKPSGGIA
ncbi:structure-specific endonuclease subunit SLX4-like isoform X2 [Sinocyclocheilus rhinocerous]|uniref:structure-specific endonuclease subunit SLX4-like isoform X2 n=1 Tax=Sinocyclocheilus rhinocerous TaxID=307959 RepID=UPI0007B896C5|nr:PREDICTED: structure-specific endonuclease subunit SLX4-like isoform X2 [Sinocyclocheilus rhinocerous]